MLASNLVRKKHCLCMSYMFIYMHTHIHTKIQTIRTYSHIHIHICTYMHTHAHIRAEGTGDAEMRCSRVEGGWLLICVCLRASFEWVGSCIWRVCLHIIHTDMLDQTHISVYICWGFIYVCLRASFEWWVCVFDVSVCILYRQTHPNEHIYLNIYICMSDSSVSIFVPVLNEFVYVYAPCVLAFLSTVCVCARGLCVCVCAYVCVSVCMCEGVYMCVRVCMLWLRTCSVIHTPNYHTDCNIHCNTHCYKCALQHTLQHLSYTATYTGFTNLCCDVSL